MISQLCYPGREVVEDGVAWKFPSWEGWRGAPGWLNTSPKNYFSLPYNPNLREREKELLKSENLCEVLMIF